MKKFILLAATVFTLGACNKTEDGNKGVLTAEDSVVAVDSASDFQEQKYRYVAPDGTNANVTFVNSDDENYIIIQSNNSTLRGSQTEAWAKGAIYKNQDVEITSEGDSITIKQGGEEYLLKKARGQ